MYTFVKDSQSRIIRYGIKCLQLIDGYKCHSFAPATKKGNKLIVSDNCEGCFGADNMPINGIYQIITEGKGRIADVLCNKLDHQNNKS